MALASCYGGCVLVSLRRILFEDAEVLAVDKPPGLVCHATVDRTRDHLHAAMQRLLAERDGDPGHLTLVHRLDRDTSGVVVFSRHPDADGPLGDAFAQRRVDKRYLAAVRLPDPDPLSATANAPLEVRRFLAPGKGPGGRTAVVRSGGQSSCTFVRELERIADMGLIEARPTTGRTHQIRVHLADLGCPILGDTLYGGDDPNVKRLLLHAATLSLPHPRTGRPLEISAPPPRALRNRFGSLRLTPP